MNEILDRIEEEIRPKTFSKWSFGTALIIMGLYTYMSSLVPSEMQFNAGGFPMIPLVLTWAFRLSCLLGFIFTILSFVKKEPSSMMKWIGAIVSGLIFLILAIAGILMIKMGKTGFFSYFSTLIQS
jgi:hypothetical protein